jgi:hypothetical protein
MKLPRLQALLRPVLLVKQADTRSAKPKLKPMGYAEPADP